MGIPFHPQKVQLLAGDLSTAKILGVDSLSVLLKHRSFQEPDPFRVFMCFFQKRFGSLGSGWNWKVPLPLPASESS